MIEPTVLEMASFLQNNPDKTGFSEATSDYWLNFSLD